MLLSNPEKEREGEDKREGERERDGLIWEHRQTICGSGLGGSRGQIPDRWKKLNMGQSRFWAQKTALVSQCGCTKPGLVSFCCRNGARLSSKILHDFGSGSLLHGWLTEVLGF